MRKPTQGPLQGIRILDLTRLLPGPLGTMLMADMGAEVIKIEDPKQPDYVRQFPPYQNGVSMNYLAFNRSKLSVLIELSTEAGKTTFMELIRTADVVVEQFRPTFLDKLGIGYEAAKEVNEKIIYVSITGYGQTGPYAHLAGHDINYTAIAGVMDVTGNENQPIVAGTQIADIAGGSYMSVIAILSALYARSQTGKGQQVDVSMTDAVMPLLTAIYHPTSAANDLLSWQNSRGNFPLSGGLPNYGVYQTNDEQFIALGTLEPKFWQKFCHLVNKPDWVSFIFPESQVQAESYKKQIAELIFSESRDYWVNIGTAHDLLITAVNSLDEIHYDSHLQAREMILEEEHPQAGKFYSIGVPLKFSETPARPSWTAPDLGADTEAVMTELSNRSENNSFY